MIINRNSPEGNAFVIMGLVESLLKSAGRAKEWPSVQKKMMDGDYNNLCKIASEATYGSIEVSGEEE